MSQPKVHNLILWQSHRSGYWICEIRDRDGFKGIGLGQTKELALQRASAITKTHIPASRIPHAVNPTPSVTPSGVNA